jgi:rhodanese-related sulfurtransferase
MVKIVREVLSVSLWIFCGALTLWGLSTTSFLSTHSPSIKVSGPQIDFPTVVDVWHRGEAIFIDVRSKSSFAWGHIPGALSIPLPQARQLIDRLPEDRSVRLITYCGGPECPNAWQFLNILIEYGYENVQLFHRGIRGWQSLGLPIEKGSSEAQ